MKTLRNALAMALVLVVPAAAVAGGCGSQNEAKAGATATFAGYDKDYGKKGDIVETAKAAGSFKTLTAALSAAGLVDALQAEGPFTVFAPTDEAFAKLPAGTVEDLLKPENKEKLTRILTYHVVSGKVTSKEVVNIEKAKALSGDKLNIATNSKGVMIGDAMVVKADVMASNGVIHVIDSVLIPN